MSCKSTSQLQDFCKMQTCVIIICSLLLISGYILYISNPDFMAISCITTLTEVPIECKCPYETHVKLHTTHAYCTVRAYCTVNMRMCHFRWFGHHVSTTVGECHLHYRITNTQDLLVIHLGLHQKACGVEPMDT